MQKIKHVVCDLDGTILNDDKKIALQDLNTLTELGKKGIIRTIATGRSFYSFKKAIPEKIPVDFLVLCSGAFVIDFNTEEVILDKSIEANQVQDIAQFLRKNKIDYQIRQPEPYGHHYFYERFASKNSDFDKLNCEYASYINPISKIENLGTASRIVSIIEDESQIKIFDKLSDKFSIIRATSPINHKTIWIEAYAKNVNKGTALDALNQRLGITNCNTIGLGNDYNDTHFLDIVSQSFITQNSPQSLRNRYTTTTDNNSAPLTQIAKRLGIV